MSSGADAEELNVRITSLRAEIARLEAEARGAKAPVFPEDLVRDHPVLIKDALAFFKTRMNRMKNQLTGQGEQIAQQERKIDEVSARLNNNRQQLKLLDEQIGISNELLKDQLSNRMQHLNLLKEASRLKCRITTKQTYFERGGVKYQLVPGVRVMASIRTGQRSVLAYLTDPFLGSFQTALRER